MATTMCSSLPILRVTILGLLTLVLVSMTITATDDFEFERDQRNNDNDFVFDNRISNFNPSSFNHHRQRPRCVEKSMEKRESDAGVIFTGTIKELYPDQHHPNMMQAKVEIKRVMKGKTIISKLPGVYPTDQNKFYRWHRRMVMVNGIGDPTICRSWAQKYDTRIFMANKVGTSELQLNSSLVRMTLHNLEHAEAAVKDVPFKPEPTPKIAPCELMFCAFGAQCRVDALTMEATCKCIESCSPKFTPVCGSDGVTYSSECNLRKTSCEQQRRIKLEFHSSCDVKDPCTDKTCSYGAHCVPSLDGLSARCQCPERCDNYGNSLGSGPVCGSDGSDYSNVCEMRRASCQGMTEIRVKYYGKCDPCKDHDCPNPQVCQLDESRRAHCACSATLCDLEFKPVCGSDGNTYSNECIMRREACKQRKDIYTLSHGDCSSGSNPCDALSCDEGQGCHVDRQGYARCTCPPPCEPVLRPVCGTDRITYDNLCALNREACLSKRKVELKFVGECSTDGPCSNYRCIFGAICVVKNNRPYCECPTCTEEFKPVCGDDKVSYANECKMKADSCDKQKNINVKYQGLCSDYNGCETMKCDHYAMCESDSLGHGQCVCPQECVQVYKPVCGTDGTTYSSECELRVTSCRIQQFIVIASQGSCDRCASVKCSHGARCEDGQCVCPQSCPMSHEPLCANDGQTYGNECEMNRQACSQGIQLEAIHSGECDDTEASGSGVMVCDETTCRFGGTCDYDGEFGGACVCDFTCEAIRSPVCGSDEKSYGSECLMRTEACKKQVEITMQPMSNCESLDEDLCDGNPPLINPLNGREYDCRSELDNCPARSYCHRKKLTHGMLARCCKEESGVIRNCKESTHGCCPDGKTAAPAVNQAGCPGTCQCNELGSYGRTCEPTTRQCYCKPGVGGLKCDRCEPGYYGLPRIAEGNSGCISCTCNIFGSVRDDCEQMTGRCVCKPGIEGQKCDQCPNGRIIGPQGCTANMPRSCTSMRCDHGAVCMMISGKQPQCICPSNCQRGETPRMVCGSNGETYGSACQLRLFSCRLQKAIHIDYEGPCRDSTTSRTPTRSRKTTRHINPSRVTHENGVPPTSKTPEDYRFIGESCQEDTACVVKHSYCRNGLCACTTGLLPSQDNTRCEERTTSPYTLPQTTPTQIHSLKNNVTMTTSATIATTENMKTTTMPPQGILSAITKATDSATVTMSDKELWGMSYSEPSFSGSDSYLQLKRVHHANRDITIQMRFKALNNDGILLYSSQNEDGKGDYLSLSLKNGHVEFRYDLGSGPAILKSRHNITLNKYHTVTVRRFDRDGMIRLDDGTDASGISPGTLKSLNLGTSIFLGFMPNADAEVFRNIGTNIAFAGCIESLQVTSGESPKDYNLMFPGSPDVEAGKGISECGSSPCSSMPCQHSGSCVDISSELYTCSCSQGYTGVHCEVSTPLDPCYPNPCMNHGTCTVLPDGAYFCSCMPSYTGGKCETAAADGPVTVPQFKGDSYLQLNTHTHMGRAFHFELWFLTLRPNGVLLYSVQTGDRLGDFMSLILVNGYVQLRFDLGSGMANVTSHSPLPLNVWHRVEIQRNGAHGTLIINGEEPIQGRTQGTLLQLNLPQKVWVGGYPTDFHPLTGSQVGLYGAVQRIYENGVRVEDLVSQSKSMKDVTQWQGPPCPVGREPCMHGGTCLPHLNDFQCRCLGQYAGKRCEMLKMHMETDKPIAFNGHTHHRYPNSIRTKQNSQKNNAIGLRFKTTMREGLLLLQHKSLTVDGDFLALAVRGGRVEASFNLGKERAGDLRKVTSAVDVSDNQWHMLDFHREKRKASLSVDNEVAVTALATPGATQLDTDGNLYIGGVRQIPHGLPDAYNHGFNGCIDSVTINKKPLNLVNDRTSHGSIEFCDLFIL